MKLTQYTWLVSLLSQHPQGYTLAQINALWQQSGVYSGRPMSRTTLYRARDTILNQFGILIECEFHRGNSCYKIANPNELQGESMKNWLYSNLAVGNLMADHTALKDRIMLEYTPVNTNHLHCMLQAMRKHLQIELEYQKYTSDSPSLRTVAPIALKLWKQRWYLLAHQQTDGQDEGSSTAFRASLRIFSLNRVKNVVLTDKPYTAPKNFSAQEYFKDCYGVLASEGMKTERIVLRAYGQTPHYLRDLPLHHSQRELKTGDGYTDFELRLKPTPDFLSHLLTHGTGIKIMSPRSVAQKMADRLREMLGEYE
jgi:hypothetical protein